MSEVLQLPVIGTADRPAPKKIVRPCDYGLLAAVRDLETQVGSVEAYNKLCDAAAKMKAKIDAGNGQAQNRMFATDPNFIYPVGHFSESKS